MRVWDIHPGYLSRQSLLGQHVEIHTIYSILSKGKKGYSNHPETRRWAHHLDILTERHDLTVKEMLLRGYNHNSPLEVPKNVYDSGNKFGYVDIPAKQFALLQDKYEKSVQTGRIPLPKNSSKFWSHHKYSVMVRGYNYYKEVQKYLNKRKDFPIILDNELIELVYKHIKKEPSESSVKNVVEHLWGYFKRISTQAEKDIFMQLKAGDFNLQFHYLYKLAVKYDKHYLIHSTVFSDLRI